jgi:hypothetical protein
MPEQRGDMETRQERFSIWYFAMGLGSLMPLQSLFDALLHG